MSDGYKTMRVPKDKWERAREQKVANGRTWGEQIVRPEDRDNDSTTNAQGVEGGVDTDAIAESVTSDLLAQLPPRIAEELR